MKHHSRKFLSKIAMYFLLVHLSWTITSGNKNNTAYEITVYEMSEEYNLEGVDNKWANLSGDDKVKATLPAWIMYGNSARPFYDFVFPCWA